MLSRLTALFIAFFISVQASALELGQGLDGTSKAEKARCFSGPTRYTGSAWSTLQTSLIDSYDIQEKSTRAHASVSIGSSFLGGEASADADNNIKHLSTALQYVYHFTFRNRMLMLSDFSLTSIGLGIFAEMPDEYRSYRNFSQWPKFRQVCGDHLVVALQTGGDLKLHVAVLAAQYKAYIRMELKLVIKSLLRKIKKTETFTLDHTSWLKEVKVFAEQKGGDQAAIRNALARVEICDPQQLKNCYEEFQRMLEYLDDPGADGFMEKAKANPAIFWHKSIPYTELFFFPPEQT